MGHLGDFGTAHEAVDTTFGFFGTTLRVNPDVTDLALMDLFTSLGAVEGGKEAVGALKGIGTALIHPDDLATFWELVRVNRQTTEDLSDLALKLLEGVTGRPTSQPSDSSAGLATTEPRSEGGSSSLVEEALRFEDGRPDRQLAILRSQPA